MACSGQSACQPPTGGNGSAYGEHYRPACIFWWVYSDAGAWRFFLRAGEAQAPAARKSPGAMKSSTALQTEYQLLIATTVVLMVNKAISEWHNKPMALFRGKPCYEVFQQQGSCARDARPMKPLKPGRPVFRERVSTTLGGKKFYFHLTAFPLRMKRAGRCAWLSM